MKRRIIITTLAVFILLLAACAIIVICRRMDATTYYNRGNAYSEKGEFDQGVADYDHAMRLEHDTGSTMAQWAQIARSEGEGSPWFNAVAVDSSGNVYAAGSQGGSGNYIYDTDISAKAVLVKYNSNGETQWVRTVSKGNDNSGFYSVAVDSSGNVYVAGYQRGSDNFIYGTGVFAKGTNKNTNNSNGYNVVLVKYNSNGEAQWARTVSEGNNDSVFNSVAVDSSDNVFAVGYQKGSGTYTYGKGVSAKGTNNMFFDGDRFSDRNAVLVKYNSNGEAQWVRTIIDRNYGSVFKTVVVDSTSNVYAAGLESYRKYMITYNAVLVKYNFNGEVQWTVRGESGSDFNEVAVDSSCSVYAVGYQERNREYIYGTGVSAKGTYDYDPGWQCGFVPGYNVVLVKYNSNGEAQWARSVSEGSKDSEFYSMAVDSSDNVYAVGYQGGSGTYTYGKGVSAKKTYNMFFYRDMFFDRNAVLVKYNSNGEAQLARTVSEGNDESVFNSVAVDSSGNIYAAGYQKGSGTYTYGKNVSVKGTDGTNAVLVKYR